MFQTRNPAGANKTALVFTVCRRLVLQYPDGKNGTCDLIKTCTKRVDQLEYQSTCCARVLRLLTSRCGTMPYLLRQEPGFPHLMLYFNFFVFCSSRGEKSQEEGAAIGVSQSCCCARVLRLLTSRFGNVPYGRNPGFHT